MTADAPLFDAARSASAREADVDRAALGSPETFARDWAVSARYVARRTEFLTTDDIVREYALRGYEMPAEPRAIGPATRALVLQRIIEPTAAFRLSELVSCHRRPKRVYRSLIYDSQLAQQLSSITRAQENDHG